MSDPPAPLTTRTVLGSLLAGAAVSLVGATVLMGIPGALLAALATPVIDLLWPAPNAFPRDSAWPFMIFTSLLWGALVPVCWLWTRRMRLRGWRRAAAVALGMLLGGLVLVLVLYALMVVPLLGE
jgi:hypothetical protein